MQIENVSEALERFPWLWAIIRDWSEHLYVGFEAAERWVFVHETKEERSDCDLWIHVRTTGKERHERVRSLGTVSSDKIVEKILAGIRPGEELLHVVFYKNNCDSPNLLLERHQVLIKGPPEDCYRLWVEGLKPARNSRSKQKRK